MRKLLLVILSITLVFALPTKDNSLENINQSETESAITHANRNSSIQWETEEESEDGWFVPQLDGSLKWVTKEEAQLKMRALTMSRSKPKEIDVKFYFYNNYFPNTPEQIYIDDVRALKKTLFNSEHKTRIIIHGWQNNYKSDVNTLIRQALFTIGEINVICVDWSDKAEFWNYYSSANAIPEVGQKVANLIDFLREEGNMKTEDLKVIGHSLGAHVSGYAGKLVRGEQLHTIIGLDTALPLFNYNKCDERLCKTDAVHVESIHTNGGLLGFLNPIGHLAFYPNGGKSQPGCGIDLTGQCSHSRAYAYYAEAIANEFFGVQCSDLKEAINKECPNKRAPSFARFDNKNNFNAKIGIFYSPVDKNAPYSKSYSILKS